MPTVEIFGIRHHGPGSARSLIAALDDFAPQVLLIELPAEAGSQAVLDLVGDVAMEPPVALLGYVNDHPERAVFLPFARFSPEWQALRWAVSRQVPIRPIDLALGHVMAGGPTGPIEASASSPPVDPIGELAAVAGDDDPERWWEDVVEHQGRTAGARAGFAAVGEAMAAVRATAPPATATEARREASMRQGVRQAERDGFERIAVVCGAWHVPALTAPLPDAAGDRALLAKLPSAKVTLTWVPWTHRRLLASGGYGAGVASPGWYAHVFDAGGDHRRWFSAVAWLLRSHDHLVSPDHVVAATRLAEGLAALRCRPRPGLAELTDAAAAVLGDGRVGPLELIHDRLVVGDVLGQVPPDAPMVPVARDLAAEQRRVRLKPAADDKLLELDLRLPLAQQRSRLLHRLLALGIPWGRSDEGRGSSGSFRESWRLRWDPELAVRLVEASAYGTTVAAAAAGRLRERAGASTVLADLVALAETCLLADLPDCMPVVLDRLALVAAERSDAGELLDLLAPLARILRYGDVRGTDAAGLAALLDGVTHRACVGLVLAASQLDDDGAALLADRLLAANAALALLDHPLRGTAWVEALQRLAADPAGSSTGHGIVTGRAVRLLGDAEVMTADETSAALSRALSPGTPARAGAAFVDGLLAGSGTVLVHDGVLLGLIDGWLAGLAADRFDEIVPLLRRTFGGFEVAERRRLGELVGGRSDGRSTGLFGWDLDEQRVRRGLATLAELWGLSPDIVSEVAR